MSKSKNKTIIGTCRICKNEKKLSFEHIPPKVAYNKNTRYYSIPHDEYYKIPDILNYKHHGQIFQGGMGEFCLCKECNSFLGSNYVRSFANWVNIGVDLVSKYEFNYCKVLTENQNPLRVLKQIISMFICINEPWFSDMYPELLDFVINPNNIILNERYKIYTYLNNEGQFRCFKWTETSDYGIICETTFPPYGYVLSIDNPNKIEHLTDITWFKYFSDNREHKFEISFYKHPTYYAMPLDFRTKTEIERDVKY